MSPRILRFEDAAAAEVVWTGEQQIAIADRGRDLFVTAAAGSGKTAVLTERVLRLVTEKRSGGRDPIPLERLLVITFTRKAARQMRERIESSLIAGLARDERNPELRAALDALPQSNVMTLDAFCDRIVRRHFHRAGVSPDVRIADEDEERDLVRAATARVFDDLAKAGEGDDAGRAFGLLISTTERRGPGSVLDALAARVHRIRTFLASLDRPTKWLVEAREELQAALETGDYDLLPEAQRAAAAIAASLRDFADALDRLGEQALALVGDVCREKTREWSEAAFAMRELAARAEAGERLTAVIDFIERWCESPIGTQLRSLANKGSCGAALYKEDHFKSEALGKFSDRFKKWMDSWLVIGSEHWITAARLAAEQCLALLDLAERVEREVQEAKRKRGVLGFGDIERKALEVLTDAASGGPSEIAFDYQRYFECVLVDEYQDISPLQDAIIRRLSHAEDPSPHVERNLFIVGDVKQSIYRFRRADPWLFRGYLDACPAEHSPADMQRRVSLRSNFRSRPGILEAANAVFERIMDRAVGGIDYDADARLVAERDEEEDESARVELHWIDSEAAIGEADEDDAISVAALEREAHWVARKILNLTSSETGLWIPDKTAADGRRRARPSDCAILVRGLSNHAETWIATLARHGLRVRAAGRDTRLSTPEMADLIAALRLADNPLQDIPLATVLRSPLVGMDEAELLQFRLARRKGPFHEAVWGELAKSENGTTTHLQKLREFAEKLDRWRVLATRATPEDVLDAILKDTHYAAHIGGLRGGPDKLKSLDYLRKLMRNHTGRAMSASGLSDFLRALDGFGDGAGAGEEDDGAQDDNAVHLLTIHKSKGLEFPIVIFARLDSKFGGGAVSDLLEMSADGGMTLCAVDPERRVRLTSPGYTAMRLREKREERAEELRLLYVAMTRAKEKLVMVGTAKLDGLEERFAASPMSFGERAPAFWRLSASSPAALIGPILHRIARAMEQDRAWLKIETHESVDAGPSAADLPAIATALQGRADWQEARAEYVNRFEDDERGAAACRTMRNESDEVEPLRPRFIAPPMEKGFLSRTPMKVTASGILRRESELVFPPVEKDEAAAFDAEPLLTYRKTDLQSHVPGFASSEDRLPAVTRGRLTHSLLQHADLRGALDESGLRDQALAMWRRGLLEIDDPKWLDHLPYEQVAAFFASELGARLRERPGAVLRELPFTRWMPAGNLFAGGEGEMQPMLVQGVIDCLLDEGSDVVLIDFKTDRVKTKKDIKELAKHYYPQIDSYRQAIRTIWRLPVRETYLAFLDAAVNWLVEEAE